MWCNPYRWESACIYGLVFCTKFWILSWCTGQIELFSHVPVLRNFVDHLKRKDFNVCAVYLLDSQVINLQLTKFSLFLFWKAAYQSQILTLEFSYISVHDRCNQVHKWVHGFSFSNDSTWTAPYQYPFQDGPCEKQKASQRVRFFFNILAYHAYLNYLVTWSILTVPLTTSFDICGA